MPILGLPNREQLTTAVVDAFDQIMASLTGYLYVQHDDEGAHTDVTADSLVVAEGGSFGDSVTVDGDGTFTGNVVAQSEETAETEIGEAVGGDNAGINGLRTGGSLGSWAIGATNVNHLGSFALADLNNTVNTTKQVVSVRITSAYGTPTTYEILPSVAASIRLDLGAYQQTNPAAGSLRSVNTAEISAGSYTGNVAATGNVTGVDLTASDDVTAGDDLVAGGDVFEKGLAVAMGHWQSYTTTWFSASNPQPAAPSSLDAKYTRIGNTCHFQIRIAFDGSSTFGTGVWGFTLPLTADITPHFAAIGSAFAFESGTNFRVGTTYLQTSVNACSVVFDSAVNFLTSAIPFTWGNGDYLMIEGTFEVAP